MRLLTHNTLRNHSAKAKGKGFPLKITATQVRVDNNNNSQQDEQAQQQQVVFVQNLLQAGTLDWPALVKAAQEVGIPTLPATLTPDMVQDTDFCKALYHILLNVHVVQGLLTCPITGQEFVIDNEIPNLMIDEEDCEAVRI